MTHPSQAGGITGVYPPTDRSPDRSVPLQSSSRSAAAATQPHPMPLSLQWPETGRQAAAAARRTLTRASQKTENGPHGVGDSMSDNCVRWWPVRPASARRLHSQCLELTRRGVTWVNLRQNRPRKNGNASHTVPLVTRVVRTRVTVVRDPRPVREDWRVHGIVRTISSATRPGAAGPGWLCVPDGRARAHCIV